MWRNSPKTGYHPASTRKDKQIASKTVIGYNPPRVRNDISLGNRADGSKIQ